MRGFWTMGTHYQMNNLAVAPPPTPVAIHKKTGIAIIPFDDRVRRMIPHCREIERRGQKLLLVPARKDELVMLRNLGYSTPNPIAINYDWNSNLPFAAQVETSGMLVLNPRAYVLNEIGTGKTLAALFAFDFLRKQGLVRKMLVIGPLSTLTTVWDREVFSRMPHLTTVVLHGATKRRRKLLAESADILIINHHGVNTILPELLAEGEIDVVCIDELAILRNHRTSLWKSINKVCTGKPYVWGMTGSPTPNDPCDAWAQIKLITPERATKYYKQFRDQTMRQLSQFRWIPRPDANDVVHAAMQPAVRYTRDDCVDLPPTTYTDVEVEMSKEQTKVFKTIKDHLYIQFQEGEVTVANEGVKVSKLLQVCCGFAYTSQGIAVQLANSSRVQAVRDIIEQSASKVIVFVPFVETLNSLHAEISKTVDAEKIYGGTAKGERDRIFNLFQNTGKVRVIIAHPQCMAHGLTLTSASTICWYSPPMSLEIYEQANGRITRPGQKLNTHIRHLSGTKLEDKYYKRLASKAKVQGALLELFEEGE